jgi:putative ABC transport system substrate-binding protein
VKIGTRQQAAGNSKKPALIGLACCTLLFALCISAEAQQPPKIPRIGFLIASSAAAQEPRLRAFKRGLRELGYIEGSNIAIEVRSGEGKPEQLPMAAAELVTLNVQVIVSGGPASTRAAKQTTNTIPIVMTLDSDPVRDGLVVSLARPGGNITGLSTLGPDLSGKRLELLREIAPRLSRVAVFYSTDTRNLPQWNEIDDAGRALGLQLQKLELQGPKDIDAAFQAAIKEHSGAVLAQAPAILLSQRTRVAELAIKSRLPTIYSREEFVQAGGLMHYAPSTSDLSRRAATFVDKILKGAKPADLPVEQPTKFELVINLKTAKQIGLTISPNVLARADRVIR